MKTIFFKTIVPYAIVLTVGTAGAFMTTSMQKSTEKAPPRLGWVTDENNIPCNKPVQCQTEVTEFCRVSYPLGEQAMGKDGNCQEILYRPDDN
ncbi:MULTISPECIES: hypothetical protein [Flavobacterium]|uniref:hypothetical protein n=1 Tax=Flavobacterium TaxID=237 RepID=UPI002113A768|nr:MULTISPECIES: hypothetical protein [Flavobacterium]UUF12597.1 hypothetical protein NLJ00_15180 [Flavobacterium panici]